MAISHATTHIFGIKPKPFIVSHGLLVGVDICHGLDLNPWPQQVDVQKIRSVPLSRRQLSLDLTRLHQGQPFWLEGEKTREGENGFLLVRCLHPPRLTFSPLKNLWDWKNDPFLLGFGNFFRGHDVKRPGGRRFKISEAVRMDFLVGC